ncbi:MAG: glycosyltransferase [Lactobacillus sp.]|nr:glycosyltransferase [Lactobacillus sp.]
MKISVVMTTYNGEKYIEEQLDSIQRQTRLPDEVLIFDDCSSDNTVEVVQKYIKKNLTVGWKIERNIKNKGWKKNFYDGIKEATGDYVFLSDQDDIWIPDKIEMMVEVLEKNKDISVLASDFSIQLEGEERSNYQSVKKQMKETKEVDRIAFDKKWYYVTRPGSTYCFRKSFFDEIEKEWNINTAHDCNLWYFATAQSKMAIYHHITMNFRRHGDNASTEHLNTVSKRYETAKMARDINVFFRDKVADDKKIVTQEIVQFCDLRMKYFESGKINDWIKLVLCNWDYYLTVKGCIADLLCVKRERWIK